MKFYSTRDPQCAHAYSLREAAFLGLAPDGGLFVPERIPAVDLDRVAALADRSYAAMATYLAGLFFEEEFSAEQLREPLEQLYNYPVPLRMVGDGRYTLELFHGPTCAFKDFGAGFMGQIFSLMRHEGERVVVLAATSGDTGSAVAHGFYDIEGVDVVLLYPQGRISRLQELQMTALGRNIHPLAIRGSFDDCQRIVKELFADADFCARKHITSANSINLLRWIPQAFYYFYGCHQWRRATGNDRPVVVVPSGNYGNLAAGMLAQRMGLPVAGFVAASNRNDIVPAFLETGVYAPRESVQTLANAMDVGAPSNFERMLWLCDHDPERLRRELVGFRCDDDCIRRTIDSLSQRAGYLSDPHSAVGYAATAHFDRSGFYLSTAHPAKFGEVIAPVTGFPVPLPVQLRDLSARSVAATTLDADRQQVKSYLVHLA